MAFTLRALTLQTTRGFLACSQSFPKIPGTTSCSAISAFTNAGPTRNSHSALYSVYLRGSSHFGLNITADTHQNLKLTVNNDVALGNSLFPQFVRGFHEGKSMLLHSSEEKIVAANELLSNVSAVAFKEQVALEAESKSIVDYAYLVQLAIDSGHTASEGEKLVDAMANAGVVLRFHNAVYLRPLEVVDSVLDRLPVIPSPDDSSALVTKYQDRLTELKAELVPLEQEMQKLHKKADSNARFYLWAGLFILTTQLVAFIRLTFWDLSWDVMEPIAYFMQLFTAIVAYLWYMFHGQEMTNTLVYDKYYTKSKAKGIRNMGEMAKSYEALAKQIHRYEQLLRWAKR